MRIKWAYKCRPHNKAGREKAIRLMTKLRLGVLTIDEARWLYDRIDIEDEKFLPDRECEILDALDTEWRTKNI